MHLDSSTAVEFHKLSQFEQEFIIKQRPYQPKAKVRGVARIIHARFENGQHRYFIEKLYDRVEFCEFSPVTKSYYCFPCRLFHTESGSIDSAFWQSGVTNFHKAKEKLVKHALTNAHLAAKSKRSRYSVYTVSYTGKHMVVWQ